MIKCKVFGHNWMTRTEICNTDVPGAYINWIVCYRCGEEVSESFMMQLERKRAYNEGLIAKP